MKTIKESQDWINSHEYKNWKFMIMDEEIRIKALKDVLGLIDETKERCTPRTKSILDELKARIEG